MAPPDGLAAQERTATQDQVVSRKAQRVARKFSRTTVDMLAEACDMGCDKRRQSLRILLGMIFSHSFRISSLPITLQESILRRVVAQLVGRPDLPLPVVLLLYSLWGEWRILAHAMRREKRLFTSFDRKINKDFLEKVFASWAELFSADKAKKKNAHKMVYVMGHASGQALLAFVFETWKTTVKQEKDKFLQRRKLAAVINNNSRDVLLRNGFLGWQETVRENKNAEQKRKAKQQQISKTMVLLDKDNKKTILIATFGSWSKETQDAKIQAERDEERLRQRQKDKDQSMQKFKMMMQSSDTFLMQDCFRNWLTITQETKMKLQNAKQLLSVLGMNQNSLLLRTTFTEWVEAQKTMKNTQNRMREVQMLFANDAKLAVENAFRSWMNFVTENKQALENSKKILLTLSSGNDKVLLTSAFGNWRDDIMQEKHSKAQAAAKDAKNQAVMRTLNMMCAEQDGMALNATFGVWAKYTTQEVTSRRNEGREAQMRGNSLKLLLNGDAKMVTVTTFRDWHMAVMMGREEFRAEQAAKRQAAEKDQKRKALMAVFDGNDKLMLSNVVSAWAKKIGDAKNAEKNNQKMMRLMAGGDSSTACMATFREWADLARKNKARGKSKEKAMKMAAQLAEGDNAMLKATIHAVWVKLVEAKKQKMEANKRLFTTIVANDSTGSQRLFFSEWNKALEICRQERRHGAQRERNRTAAGNMVNNMLAATLAGGFGAWKQYLVDRRADKAHEKKQETMGLLLGGGNGPMLLTRCLTSWVDVIKERKQEEELAKIMRKEEAADNQKAWAGNRIFQDAQTTAFMGIFLHWAYAAVATKLERTKNKLAFRNQQLPLMTHDLLGRLIVRDTDATLHRFVNAWRWQTAVPKSSSRAAVQKTHAAVTLASISGPLRAALVAWGSYVRARNQKDAARVRFQRAANAGIVRWLAADAVMTLSTSFRTWWQEATAEKRLQMSMGMQSMSAEARERMEEAARWRDEAAKTKAALARAKKAAETAVGSAMARSMAEAGLGVTFQAWRKALMDKQGEAMRKHEKSRAREAASQKAAGSILANTEQGIQMKAMAAWKLVTQENRTTSVAGSIYVFGGFGSHHSPFEAERLNVNTGQWEVLPKMPGPRCAAAAACLGGRIYVVGGFSGSQHLDTAVRLSPGAARWEQLHEMGERRGYVAAAATHDSLFAIGGFNGAGRLSSAEVYEPNSRAWTRLPLMNVRRQCAAAAMLDGKIYVAGGDDGSGATDSVERLDPRGKRWELLPPLAQRRSGAAAVVVLGKLLVAGGSDHDPLATCEEFDPETHTWSALPTMRVRRDGLGAAAIGDAVYVFGGHDGALRQKSMERLPPQGPRWEDVPFSSSLGRNFCAVAAGPAR